MRAHVRVHLGVGICAAAVGGLRVGRLLAKTLQPTALVAWVRCILCDRHALDSFSKWA